MYRLTRFPAILLGGLVLGCSQDSVGPAPRSEPLRPAFASVTPVLVAGNPTCTGLGYQQGFLLDPPISGTYGVGSSHSLTLQNDGTDATWSATLGIDAVIVKGGPNANVYVYDPPAEAVADQDLSAPIDPNDGDPFAISYVEFCYDIELLVTKTAQTSFTRTWSWTIDKTASPSTLTLTDGQEFQVDYSVFGTASDTDSDWAVSGTITIANATGASATITGVSDAISGAGTATVECGVSFPYALGDGTSLTCSYSASLPDGTSRTNTATVTTSGAVGGGSGTANVVFGSPTTEVDECIDVTDSNVGLLGTVCAAAAPYSFLYSLIFGATATADVTLSCGANTHTNTASFVTNDAGVTGSQDRTVSATVDCAPVCTFGAGYWRSHSADGNAARDATWDLIGPAAENTVFFLSGGSWYQVLSARAGGNTWYQLAHAYITARLNQLRGSVMPAAVQSAFDDATDLFGTHTPDAIGGLKGNSPLRRQFRQLTDVLNAFNSGATGPGACAAL